MHDASCVPSVRDVTLTPTGDDSLTNTQTDLAALGYNRTDRKYMVFVDANVYCGIGSFRDDDPPGAGQPQQRRPVVRPHRHRLLGRPSVAAHELMHNLGGVQLSAPHSSGGWHCIDEYDRMCY